MRTIAEMRYDSANRDGFITPVELVEIIKANPYERLLIRHTLGRLICTAADVAIHCEMIRNWPDTRVRDISWPAPRGMGDAWTAGTLRADGECGRNT